MPETQLPNPVPPQNPESSSTYFPSYTMESGSSFKQKYEPFLIKIRYWLQQAWPYINRLLNFLFYETLKTVKGIAKIAVSQVRQK